MSTFACGQCGAALAFAGVLTEICPFCASPSFLERPPAADQPDPNFVLTFTGDASTARAAIDRWIGSRTLFADSALKHARVEDLRGIYIPAYLYSAVANTDYTAQIGEHYTETKTVTVKGPDGKQRTETRTVTRTEYRALSGRHIGYVTDVVVSASHGLTHDELARVEPFDMRQMRRFAPTLISGWPTEEFARKAGDCERASRAEAIEKVGDTLRKFMPGDSYSDLAWNTRVSWESLDPILVPIWVLALHYREDKPPVRVVINGQTGKIAGRVPLSWWKLALAAVLLAAITAVIIYLTRTPPP